MKDNLIIAALLGIIWAGCTVSGRDKHSDTLSPTLAYTDPASTANYEKYHDLVADFMKANLLQRGFNGAILVAKDSTVVYETYHGRIDLRKKDSIHEHTAFHIASTSKTMTGMAMLQLVEQGLVRLDQPLEEFFPGFPYPGVTVRLLLTHRSGIPNYLYFLEKGKWNKQIRISNQGVLDALYSMKPGKESRPNSRFSYCNTNYVLLALIIEKVTGQPFPVYMKDKIFTPLGMTDTYVYTPDMETTVTPSFQYNGALWRLDFADDTYGDKNIYSTPSDLLKWSLAVHGKEVVKDSMLQLALTPHSLERPSMHNYGLGWRMITLPNKKTVYYHNGRWHGNNSAFAYLPEEKVTIIIVGNKYNINIYRTARKAYDIFGQYLQDDVEDAGEESLIVEAEEKPGNMGSPAPLVAKKD